MSQYDLMKLFSRYDSEVCEGDFTPEELEEGAEPADDALPEAGCPQAAKEAAMDNVSARETVRVQNFICTLLIALQHFCLDIPFYRFFTDFIITSYWPHRQFCLIFPS